MRSFFQKKLNKTEEIENEKWADSIFEKMSANLKPKKELLSGILSRLENTENVKVTNIESIRNSIIEEGRNVQVNVFTNFIMKMRNIIKILSGTAIVSALVLVIIFVAKNNNSNIGPVLENGSNSINNEAVLTSELAEVDSFIAELSAMDVDLQEPELDDSDLLLELINTEDYEI